MQGVLGSEGLNYTSFPQQPLNNRNLEPHSQRLTDSRTDSRPSTTRAEGLNSMVSTAEAAGETVMAVAKSFKDLGVTDPICEACKSLKYVQPTPIQVESIPLSIEGRDIIGLAETGSGKTAAFVIPIIQRLLEKPQKLFGLILSPTRELAAQIAQVVEAIGAVVNVRAALIVGGLDMVAQQIALARGPHIVVATPGMSP